MKFFTLRQYVRFKPFLTTTEQGRTAERYRLAALSIIANILSKGMAMLVMVLSISLTVPYLGAERFGVWMTIASFAVMLTFLDLGVGNAMTNHVARTAATDDPGALRRTISGGLGILLLIGLTIGTALWFIAGSLPWSTLINVDNTALTSEARQAAMLFALLFGINIFTSGVQRVFAGLQRAFEGHLAAAFGSLIAIMGIWWASKQNADIPALLLVTLGSQSFASFILLYVLQRRDLFRIRGIVTAARKNAYSLFHIGGLFFLLQIGTMVGWGADALIVSSVLGASYVAIYSVTQRLFQFISQPLVILNSPLWASYADAKARGDTAFIRKTLKRSMLLTGFSSVVGVLVVLISSQWLIESLTDGKVKAEPIFIFFFAIWSVCEALGNSFAMFMNGVQIIRQQVIFVFMFISIVLPLKILSIRYFGLTGIPAASIVAYVITAGVVYGFIFRSDLSQVLKKQQKDCL